MNDFTSISDFEDYPPESLLAVWHYMGHQIDDLHLEWARIEQLRGEVLGRYHGIAPQEKDEES